MVNSLSKEVNPKDTMADEDKKPEAKPDEKLDKKEEPKVPAWKVVAGDKFKDEVELAKAYSELEKEKGRMAEDLGHAREFTETIQPLLEVIRDDPELFKQLDEKLKKKGQPKDFAKATPDEKSKATQEVRSVATDLIISRFEEKKGIDKLDADGKKAIRERIGTTIAEMTGQALTDIDLRRLETVLENAYILANKDEVIKKSELEAQLKQQGLDAGSIGSLSSSQGKKEDSLTPDEAKVASKMGLTREQYLEGKKKSGR